MQFGIFERALNTAGVKLKSSGPSLAAPNEVTTTPHRNRTVRATQLDPYTNHRELSQLRAKDQLEILLQELERLTKEQLQIEDTFFKLAVRMREAEASVGVPATTSKTRLNMHERRLTRELERLDALFPQFDATLEKIRLIDLQLKIVNFRPEEDELRQGRDDCVKAIADFVERAKSCVLNAEEERTRIVTGLRDLAEVIEGDAG